MKNCHWRSPICLGQVVYKSKFAAVAGKINEEVQLGNNLANGMYMLNLISGTESKIFHVVLEK